MEKEFYHGESNKSPVRKWVAWCMSFEKIDDFLVWFTPWKLKAKKDINTTFKKISQNSYISKNYYIRLQSFQD